MLCQQLLASTLQQHANQVSWIGVQINIPRCSPGWKSTHPMPSPLDFHAKQFQEISVVGHCDMENREQNLACRPHSFGLFFWTCFLDNADTVAILSLLWKKHSCVIVCGNVPLCYLIICQDHVIALVKTLMCGENDRPTWTGVIFQSLSTMFELSSPLILNILKKGLLRLPPCPCEILWMLWDQGDLVFVSIWIRNSRKLHSAFCINYQGVELLMQEKNILTHSLYMNNLNFHKSVLNSLCDSTCGPTGHKHRGDAGFKVEQSLAVLVQAPWALFVASVILCSLTLGGMAQDHRCGSLLVACWMSHTLCHQPPHLASC